MSARSASASRSKCSLMCSSNDSGTPTGTNVSGGAAAVAFAAICRRRSISRTSSRVLVEAQAIGRIEPDFEPRQASDERVEDAPVVLPARGALLGRAAVAEHALEHDLRVQLHRQRGRRRRPRDAVRVGAAVAFAAVARVRAGIFDGELHRREQVVLSDLLRDHLVDRRAVVDVGARRPLGLVRTEVGRSHPVVGRALAGRRFRRTGVKAAQDHRLLPVRFERLEDRRHLEAGSHFVRHPVSRRHAVGNKRGDEPRLRRGGRLRQKRRGRHHRVQQRQGERRAGAAQERPPGKVLLRDKHGFLFRAQRAAACCWTSAPLMLFWNGALLTTPSTSVEKR